MPAAEHPILETRGLTVRFGGHVAVNEVSCAFHPGTLTAIVGPNGAGKTTYFNLMSGQLRPSSGRVLLFGEDVTDDPAPVRTRKGMGRAFQLTNLFPLLTVRATNVYGSRQQLFKIIPRSAIYVKIGKTIELHGGGRAVKSYIHIRDVSKGEKAILERGRVGELYHLSPDNGVEVRQVVSTICDRLGKPFETAARAVDERPGQDAAYVIDSTKARTELSWKSTISLEEGLTDVVDWVNQYWPQIQTQTLEYRHAA